MFKKRFHLFRQTPFRRYFYGGVMSMFGNGLGYVLMTWLVVSRDHTVASVTWLMLMFWLPVVVAGPLVGVMVDRYPRKYVLLIASVCRVLVWLVFGLYYFVHLSVVGLDSLALVGGLFWGVTFTTGMSFIREIVKQKELLVANVNMDIGYEIGNAVGLGLAGFMLVLFPDPLCFLITALCFLVSTLLWWGVPVTHRVTEFKPVSLKQLGLDYWESMRYLNDNRSTCLVYLVQFFMFLTYTTAPILLAPFAHNVLHADAAQFGGIETGLSLGIILGGVLAPRWTEKYGPVKVCLYLTILAALAFVAFSFNRSISLAMLIYFVLGVGFANWPLMVTLAQDKTAFEFQGRVQSTFNSLLGVGVIATFLLVDLASRLYSVESLYLVEVLLVCLTVGLLLRCGSRENTGYV